jgi:hypothetical protein
MADSHIPLDLSLIDVIVLYLPGFIKIRKSVCGALSGLMKSRCNHRLNQKEMRHLTMTQMQPFVPDEDPVSNT